MRIYEGGEKGPACVLCAVDADCVDASVLVEQRRVHVQRRKQSRCIYPMPLPSSNAHRKLTKIPFDSVSHGIHALWHPLFSALRLCSFISLR